ncbi:hypothetical protein A2962_04865 [Candidatus Woesebacteria bacterium RIFCSPLOWO2_01_FULL_39_61]|uniref:ATP-cone domain-containing protein n=1 Tax=Candidatus Woesebacteria bacterium RIFCSPHIGHO2_02_FULL_39_13 TaxID=1802505 RepID=A0A1F7Z3Z7_9BACT|nr:MAG: hypothetical protein A2692_00830 [Candidatus Woesebacteria bacterium RIFCSPHIGHO2_01_FULL_39_95]OGM34247.1 MAG: hypothetical protein A3D01_01855 [Candidatus Woesebacteria bacterium RIFCSPHIGHO2_02_FULL_39_13]OGM38592.1 MAG: hypothetical protein A3E13_00375 [Candidatus Woesebacteria bacterium RIFCSPHIGHO2_12_FULL_40_20]OGM67077.1 MAG: hypothetical protein A2962_04865 [Candidatus Woesebacteria bacterium RIFCSPLOWO2_01_FULL_39_61]OGM71722.1 MAG: hypothetical protein A3H19_03465 [Candidatus
MELKVIKRNLNKENYNPEKIIKVVAAAGLSQESAKALSDRVSGWLEKRGKPEVTSLQIRDKVIVEIQKIDRGAARKFIWYEKYRDKNYGVNY